AVFTTSWIGSKVVGTIQSADRKKLCWIGSGKTAKSGKGELKMDIFDECIEALRNEGEVIVLSEEESNEVLKEFKENIPLDWFVGKVDFNRIPRKKEIVDDEDILEEL